MAEDVVVDGVRLSVNARGEGPAVLFISGTGMPAAAWELFGASELVDRGFRVVTFDNRGVGRSDGPPGPYSVEMMAADTARLVEELGIGPVSVVGLSLGGSIAQQLAVWRPDLVHAVVLWASVGRTPSFFRRLLAVERELSYSTPVPVSWHIWQYLLIALPFDVLQNDDVLVDEVAELLESAIEWSGDGRAGQFAADIAWDTSDHHGLYPRITQPCLVLSHEHDLIYPPAAAREAVRAMPNGRLVEIPRLAHGQALEAAPIVMRHVMSFLDEVVKS
jgi:thioesterase CepJ